MHRRIEKTSFFQHRFFIDFSLILASIWEGLGEVWGPKMGKLGSKKRLKIELRFLKDLGGVWGGFGEGFGRVLGGFWEGLGAFWALWGPPKAFF